MDSTIKRRRARKSCLCDQQKPICSMCKRRKYPGKCVYKEDIEVDETVQQDQENSKADHDSWSVLLKRVQLLENTLKEQQGKHHQHHGFTPSCGSNIHDLLSEDTDCHTLNFNNDELPGTTSTFTGPLSWVSLVRKDRYLSSFTLTLQKHRRDHDSQIQNDPTWIELSKAYAKHFDYETAPLKDVKQSSIVETVTDLMKDKRLVWLLVDKFFDSDFAQVLPVLLREQFIEQVESLMGGRSEEDSKINFTRRDQCPIAGLLLLVMRMASLSVYNMKPLTSMAMSEDDNYIFLNPVTRSAVEAADRCIQESKKLLQVSLPFFQLSLLKRYYELIAPEDYDCMRVTPPGKFGELLHYAIQCSLNRDPSKADNGLNISDNFARRLWFMVLQLDINHLMLVGGPSLLDEKMYDTELPRLNECESPTEFIMDKNIVDFGALAEQAHKVLTDILRVRDPPTVREIKTKLQPIQEKVDQFSSVEDIISRPSITMLDRMTKLKQMFILVNSICVLMMIHYHLFLYYCKHNDRESALDHYIKVLKMTSRLYPTILFFDQNNSIYDMSVHFGCAVLFVPKLEMFLHKTMHILCSIVARIKTFKLISSGPNVRKMAVMDKIVILVLVSLTNILKAFEVMSSTHLHAWIVSRVASFAAKRLYTLEPGYSMVPTEIDLDIIRQFNRSGDDDEIFFHFTECDLERIYQTLLPFSETDNKISSTGLKIMPDTSGESSRWLMETVRELAEKRPQAEPNSIHTSVTMSQNEKLGSTAATVRSPIATTTRSPTAADNPLYETNFAMTDFTSDELETYFLTHTFG
ncbi:hypothetical protein BN1211_2606 [Cyberlindnera jadinii]|uniref:Xylanolytic transcriptional activator regulatory domain-containing protein n=1 Tax=Cyberlindnera jadinii (strain ATCC 18201 / CBS 1600 / BCRC 20928 / JCM 3617 / NBRC 0987 / NRRL Y-1542) TaxID=983966 RepID=A0A0H5C3M8_CYBJN|nr:hypothetical protein BN1211_2606 [Cyberlindnera jadinii]